MYCQQHTAAMIYRKSNAAKRGDMQKLVRISTAAELLGVRPSTLRDWFLKRKNLDFVKCGRAVCVTEESIQRFIAANTIPARVQR